MSGFEDTRTLTDAADQDPRDLTYAIEAPWRFTNASRCRSCRAAVGWAVNADTGRKQPFNPDGSSHFATCPDANTWRTPKPAADGGAAAAVAVVEAARRVGCEAVIRYAIAGEVASERCGDCPACLLQEAVEAFDRAVKVSR